MSMLWLPKIYTKLHQQLTCYDVQNCQKKESFSCHQRSRWKLLRLSLRLVVAHQKQRRQQM